MATTKFWVPPVWASVSAARSRRNAACRAAALSPLQRAPGHVWIVPLMYWLNCGYVVHTRVQFGDIENHSQPWNLHGHKCIDHYFNQKAVL